MYPIMPSQQAAGPDGSRGGTGGQEVGRVLTEALHGVRAEDLAGPLGPEVVTGNIFTVTPTEHHLVAVFFLLRFQSSWVRALICAIRMWAPTQGPAASVFLVGGGFPEPHRLLCCALPQARTLGWARADQGRAVPVSSQTSSPCPFPGTGKCLFLPAKFKTGHPSGSIRGKDNATRPNPP